MFPSVICIAHSYYSVEYGRETFPFIKTSTCIPFNKYREENTGLQICL